MPLIGWAQTKNHPYSLTSIPMGLRAGKLKDQSAQPCCPVPLQLILWCPWQRRVTSFKSSYQNNLKHAMSIFVLQAELLLNEMGICYLCSIFSLFHFSNPIYLCLFVWLFLSVGTPRWVFLSVRLPLCVRLTTCACLFMHPKQISKQFSACLFWSSHGSTSRLISRMIIRVYLIAAPGPTWMRPWIR